jgi:hypothetical protein
MVVLNGTPFYIGYLLKVMLASIFYYMYVHFFPMNSVYLTGLLYLAYILILLCLNVNKFTMKLDFFFMTVQSRISNVFTLRYAK